MSKVSDYKNFMYYDYMINILYNKIYSTNDIITYSSFTNEHKEINYKSSFGNDLSPIDKLYKEFLYNKRKKTCIVINNIGIDAISGSYSYIDNKSYSDIKYIINLRGLDYVYFMFYNYDFCSPKSEIYISKKVYTKKSYLDFLDDNKISVNIEKIDVSDFIHKILCIKQYKYVISMVNK